MRNLFTFLLVMLILLILPQGVKASAGPSSQVDKFLSAAKKRDIKTIFDNTYYYQSQLSQIKQNNPKALWAKITSEYYETKKRALGNKDYWSSYLNNFI